MLPLCFFSSLLLLLIVVVVVVVVIVMFIFNRVCDGTTKAKYDGFQTR